MKLQFNESQSGLGHGNQGPWGSREDQLHRHDNVLCPGQDADTSQGPEGQGKQESNVEAC